MTRSNAYKCLASRLSVVLKVAVAICCFCLSPWGAFAQVQTMPGSSVQRGTATGALGNATASVHRAASGRQAAINKSGDALSRSRSRRARATVASPVDSDDFDFGRGTKPALLDSDAETVFASPTRAYAQFASQDSVGPGTPVLIGEPVGLRSRLPNAACPSGGTCWVGGTVGFWSNSGNWSNGVPTSTTDVFIDNSLPQASAVTLDLTNAKAHSLTVDNDDRLSLSDNTSLTINGGSIANAGKITVNSTGDSTALIVNQPTVTLSGGGVVTLADSPNPQNFIYGGARSDTLANQETIQGSGNIGDNSMALNNSGTINANNADNALTVQTSNGATNTGTLEATNGATLVLQGDKYNNKGGTIKATGGGAVQLYSGATIQGGKLTTDAGNGSVIETVFGDDSITLDGATQGVLANTGAFAVANNSSAYVKGTINNTGTITLNGLYYSSSLVLSANTTLMGAGTVILADTGQPMNYIYGAAATDVLTNQQTIQGSGNIGDGQMALNNQGTINANNADNPLTIHTSRGVTNTKTLEATNGGTLVLQGDIYTNTGGTIKATGGGTVELYSGATIEGGTLTTDSGNGSTIQTVSGDRSITLDGVTKGVLTNSGPFVVVNNSTAFLKGTINNTGSFTLNGTYYGTYLELSGNTTLTGGGTVTLAPSVNPSDAIYSSSPAFALTNVNNLISGSGVIGNSSMILNNQAAGTIIANVPGQPLTVSVAPSVISTNAGLMEATSSSAANGRVFLVLSGGIIKNLGGTVQATNGGIVQLAGGVTLEGGTITTDTGNGSLVEALNGGLDGSKAGIGQVTNSGTFVVVGGGAGYLNGTINNTGSIALGGSLYYPYNATLELVGNTVLTGAGTVTLTDTASPANYIYGAVGTDVLTNQQTIQGSGDIGNGALTLVNSATINATNPDNPLEINTSNGTTNTGILKATNGATLELASDLFNNKGGTIEAIGGGAVVLTQGATIEGGTLTTSGAGSVIETGSGSSGFLNGITQGALTNAGTFVVANNSTAFITGTITNTGSIALNGRGNQTSLELSGNAILTGTVTLTDSVSPTNYIFGQLGTYVLTNQQTIQGSGDIGDGSLTLVNPGTINANNADNPLEINTSHGTTNTGTLEATNGGTLVLATDVFTNSGATIQAAAGSTVQLTSGAIIRGGTLKTAGSGSLIETVGSATLDGVTNGALTNSGAFAVANGSIAYVTGTINNTGSIAINGQGANTVLDLSGDTTLMGKGTVTLTSSAAPTNYITATAATNVFTNVNNTIMGSGTIGNGTLTFANQKSGTINANVSGQSLTISVTPTSVATNAGLMEATESGIPNGPSFLVLSGGTINNTGGTIKATGGGVVQLTNSVTIQGGTLTTDSGKGSLIEAIGAATLDGLATDQGTLTNAGTFVVPNGNTIYTMGTINNTSSIALNGAGSSSVLELSGDTTLMGSGTVTLTDSGVPTNYILAQQPTFTLTNKQTIQGSGDIGDGQMAMVNQGIIDANNHDNSLEINTSNGTTNTGTVEATNRGTLILSSDIFNNLGGTIQATGGGTVELTNGVTIQGGTLTTDSGKGSLIEVSGSATLDGLASDQGTLTNSGVFVVLNGSRAEITGTINNTGSITLKALGGGTSLQLLDDTTLTGSGTVTLTDSLLPFNYIVGNGTLTNQNNLIQGSGYLGNGEIGIINNGTILANGTHPLVIQPATTASFTNNGTLQVAAGSLMQIANPSASFANFANNTLTGGTYVVGGTLEIDQLGTTGGEIVTDAANITLNGPKSSIIDANGLDGLSALNTIAVGGGFTINGGRKFTTAGGFTNNGTLTIGAGSTFDASGTLSNLSGTTLTGGTYNVTGTLEFGGKGTSLVTNAANITVAGASAKIIDSAAENILAAFATNAAGASFTVTGGDTFTTKGNFTNNGTLAVGDSTSKFDVNGNLTNFAGTTLTGGTYNVSGTLQFNGANIVTNAANITLTGGSAKILNQSSANGLANFATNAAAGVFALAGGPNFTSAAGLSNAGKVNVSNGSTLTVGANGTYTQTAGKTTVDGTLATTSPGAIKISGGSVFGNGGIFKGNVTSTGAFNIGDALKQAGLLSITGTYTQGAAGSLTTDIGGATASTLFDQLNVTGAASLTGTLDIDLINSFTPTLGETFDILNASTVSGKFSTVNGTAINGSEHFGVVYDSNEVLLQVDSGASGPTAAFTGTTPTDSATPEPGSLVLLGTALLALAWGFRRRLLRGSSKM